MNDEDMVKTLGVIMAHQDNRATQYPLYVIRAEERQYVEAGNDYDERERVEDTNEVDLCRSCTALYDDDKELPEECGDCDPEAFDHYKIVTYFAVDQAGVFFTEQGCQSHIDANSYHYRNPTVYGIGAWRNYEMQSVMRHLITNGGEKIPSHYE